MPSAQDSSPKSSGHADRYLGWLALSAALLLLFVFIPLYTKTGLTGDALETSNLFDQASVARVQTELIALLDARSDDHQPINTQVGMA